MTEGVLVLDDFMRITQMNPVAEKMLGLEFSRVSQQPLDKVLKLDVALFDSTDVQHQIVVGTEIAPLYFELHARALKKSGGALVGWVVTLRDVTDYKLITEIERRRAEELEVLRDTMSEISRELELNKLLGTIVEKAIGLLHASSGSINLMNMDRNELEVLVKPDETKNAAAVQGGVRRPMEGTAVKDAETSTPSATDVELIAPLTEGDAEIGRIRVSDVRAGRKFTPDDARLLEMFAQQAMIAIKNARLFEEVQRLSISDPLTGLFNRRHFFELVETEIARSRRYQKPLSVIMLDIDRFKQVNDNFGHFAGDQVLQQVASVCLHCLRSVDVICRYGGEEFLIMLPETPLENAQHTAERLRLRVAETETITNQGTVKVTISLGVSALIEISEQTDALFARADKALYRAKQAGRDRVSI
jgi:diguanylate cyclase (GGDEF)-like protein